jgi:hypothetical protein
MYTGETDPKLVLFIDEPWFLLSGYINSKNYRHGSAENSTLSYEVLLQIRLVCCVPWEQLKLLGPFGFPNTTTSFWCYTHSDMLWIPVRSRQNLSSSATIQWIISHQNTMWQSKITHAIAAQLVFPNFFPFRSCSVRELWLHIILQNARKVENLTRLIRPISF